MVSSDAVELRAEEMDRGALPDMSEKTAKALGAKHRGGQQKQYRPGFMWGQLSSWFKQVRRLRP
eukprot:2510541-Pyramimonas_sp.AAC.1